MRREIELRHYGMVLIGAKLPVSQKDPREEMERVGELPGLKPLDPFRFAK